MRLADRNPRRSHLRLSTPLSASPFRRPVALPILRAKPPKLSQHVAELAAIEDSGIYSNYGPVNTQLEREFISSMFREGECLTVCNATIGLMLAIREVIGENRSPRRRYALMPSFTFAATAHAALWCGLTPLLCDIDPETWLPDPHSEQALLERYEGEIAVVVPYATFGNNLDLSHYEEISQRYRVPIVVDAAASLGSIDADGKCFGSGFTWPVVFSMHATKSFSVGEGGIIYCADVERIARLRAMGSFGFGEPRSATVLGLNSKLTEVSALTALLQLRQFSGVVAHRTAISRTYQRELRGEFALQSSVGRLQVRSFESVLLPRHRGPLRSEIVQRLAAQRVGAATYFSPHLAQQPYFQKHAVSGPLPITDDIAGRVVSLPLLADMTEEDVVRVCLAFRESTRQAPRQDKLAQLFGSYPPVIGASMSYAKIQPGLTIAEGQLSALIQADPRVIA